MKRIRSLLTAAGLALALTATATAQDYPNKPVRILVPFAPGGINDVAARLLAQHLSEKLGKQFLAENVPGGGGMTCSKASSRSQWWSPARTRWRCIPIFPPRP